MTATDSFVFMLLQGWLAKGSFEREQNAFGWFWLCVSAYNLANVMSFIF